MRQTRSTGNGGSTCSTPKLATGLFLYFLAVPIFLAVSTVRQASKSNRMSNIASLQKGAEEKMLLPALESNMGINPRQPSRVESGTRNSHSSDSEASPKPNEAKHERRRRRQRERKQATTAARALEAKRRQKDEEARLSKEAREKERLASESANKSQLEEPEERPANASATAAQRKKEEGARFGKEAGAERTAEKTKSERLASREAKRAHQEKLESQHAAPKRAVAAQYRKHPGAQERVEVNDDATIVVDSNDTVDVPDSLRQLLNDADARLQDALSLARGKYRGRQSEKAFRNGHILPATPSPSSFTMARRSSEEEVPGTVAAAQEQVEEERPER